MCAGDGVNDQNRGDGASSWPGTIKNVGFKRVYIGFENERLQVGIQNECGNRSKRYQSGRL